MVGNAWFHLADARLGQRLVLAERDCMRDWLGAMLEVERNPFGVEVREYGAATALVCSKIPAQVFNRVFNMTAADREHIPAILEFYRERDAEPLFDMSPYSTEAYWVGETVPTVLARQGLFAGAFHQMLYGVPVAEVPELPPGIEIRDVGEAEVGDFMGTYERVWGDAGAIKVLVGREEFVCYVAYVDGQAAGLGVLHVANGVGSMANALTVPALRGRGCQTALLWRRMAEASKRGCDLLVSQCMPGSDSQRNQLRVGLRVAGTKAWWVPLGGSR
ncbi:MAG: hypothetical protein ABIQ44_01845 [Chloroflexia bacterium]